MASCGRTEAGLLDRPLLLASGEWAAFSGNRIAAPWQTEEWSMPRHPGAPFGASVPRIEVVQVAPWRPETVAPRSLPLIACRQAAPAWMASPLNPRQHKPDDIRAGGTIWQSREDALRAAAAGAMIQARRGYRLTEQPGYAAGISREDCRRIVAWARSVAGLPATPKGYEALEEHRPAVAADGQMALFEEVGA